MVAARISEILLQRILKVSFFHKESKSNKKKILAGGRGGCVARVIDFFFQKNPSLKKKNYFVLRG